MISYRVVTGKLAEQGGDILRTMDSIVLAGMAKRYRKLK